MQVWVGVGACVSMLPHSLFPSVDSVPLAPLKRQSPKVDIQVGVAWGPRKLGPIILGGRELTNAGWFGVARWGGAVITSLVDHHVDPHGPNLLRTGENGNG